MTRRLSLLFASIGVIAAAVAASLYAPQLVPTPPPVDADYLRACLEPRPELIEDDTEASDNARPIQIEFRTVRWDASQLNAFGDVNQPVTGVVKDLNQLLRRAQGDWSTRIAQVPQIKVKPDSSFSFEMGMIRPVCNNESARVFCGVKFEGNAILRRDGRLRVEIEFDLTDSVPGSRRPPCAELAPKDVIRAKSVFLLNSQETGFIGGLRRKNQTSMESRIPFPFLNLMSFSREIELEEEYLILVTPSVVGMETVYQR